MSRRGGEGAGSGGDSVLICAATQVPGDHADGRRPEQHRQVPGAERRARSVPRVPAAARAEGGRGSGGRAGAQGAEPDAPAVSPSQYIHSAGIIHRVGAAREGRRVGLLRRRLCLRSRRARPAGPEAQQLGGERGLRAAGERLGEGLAGRPAGRRSPGGADKPGGASRSWTSGSRARRTRR